MKQLIFKYFSIAGLIFALLACGPAPQNHVVQVVPARTNETKNGFYAVGGHEVSWNFSPVLFSFDASFPANFRAGCLAAVQIWNDAIGRNQLQQSVSGAPHVEIFFGRRSLPLNREAAETTLSIQGTTIIHAIIDFDAKTPFSTTGAIRKVDVESVCIHEFGHVLGLAHTTSLDSIMYPEININIPAKRMLSPEDIGNVRRQY